jgi:hypothetical protein
METEQGKLPPPPGLVASLTRGFDSVATHILVILPPVLLDLFLWLGPHLRLKGFLQPFIDSFPALLKSLPTSIPDIAPIQAMWEDIATQFNLFAVLRTFPVGTTSLLGLQMSERNPYGFAISIDAGSFFGVAGWCILLVLLGWVIGASYYYWVSRISIQPELHSFWKSVVQTLLLSAIWMGLLIIFGIPIFMLLSAISFFSPLLGEIMLFIGAMLIIWLLMPIFFSAHGIFTLQLDAFKAILNSLRMVRFTLPNTGLFLLIFIVINQGLNFLWNTPPQNSWWMLVGIAGHAFVSTALLAASFIYYRDINAWLTVVFEQLKKQASSAKI